MKSVLISIQPKWCELIASGKKTVEVRKTRPKMETPFKCYIYCTQGKFKDLGVIGQTMYLKRMKVIGEFVCNVINPIYFQSIEKQAICAIAIGNGDREYYDNSCMSYKEAYRYLKSAKKAYGWHISDLVIYDKPKSLSDFRLACDREKCGKCKRSITHKLSCNAGLTRPPQSWCYVESEG